MQKLLLFLPLLFSLISFGQSADIFISEYVDGSSGHQAIELYNGTGQPVNLKSYTLKMSSSGAGWAWNATTSAIDSVYILQLGDIVLPNDSVYVICNEAATRTGFRDHVDLFVDATTGLPGSKIIGYNGNDAVGLFKKGVLIDVFGPEIVTASPVPDVDVAGVTGAGADHTLIRKPAVMNGNTNWAVSAGTTTENSEWIVKDKNDASNLGKHLQSNLFISEYIDGSSGHQAIEVYNGTGKTISLDGYSLKMSSSGAGWAWNSTTSAIDSLYIFNFGEVSLGKDSVYVICNEAATRTGFRDHVDLFVDATTGLPGSKIVGYNGNDAIGLFINNILVDVVGPEKSDSASVPDFDVAGVTGAGADHTLIRKTTVTKGNTNWPASAGTSADDSEWIVKAKNDASNLGNYEQSTLIISEYVDGSSGHQAIELYNGTGNPVNLKNYSLKMSSSGAGWAWNATNSAIDSIYILQLGDILLAADSVYVICNEAATRTGFRDHVDLFVDGTTGLPGSKIIGYNGNDAIGLFYNNVLVDVVGPEIVFAASIPDFDAAGVTGAGADHTLLRKPAIKKGNTNWPASAGTNADDSEWIVKDKNDASNLGVHNKVVTSVQINETGLTRIYPNPFSETLNISTSEEISSINITNITGQTVYTNKQIDRNQVINTATFRNGIYIVSMVTSVGEKVSYKIVKNQ